MNKARLLLGLLAGLLLVGSQTPRLLAADETPAQPFVVLIGINNYQDPQIVGRQRAEEDAKALYDLFINKNHLGVERNHIKLLLGSPDARRKSELANRENILQAMQWVAQNARKDDMVIIGWFGQGAPLGERSCYFAVDSTFKNRAKDAVASDDIRQQLDKLKSSRLVVFLDVNFRGFKVGKGEKAPDPNVGSFYREFLGSDDDTASPSSRVVFLANNGLKPSLITDDHGVFAKVLLEGLQGKADNFGYEPDGLITVEELAKYVRKELPEWNRKIGKTDDEKGLSPLVLEGQLQDFVLDLNPAVTPMVQKRIQAIEKIAKDNELQASVLEEGKNLLRRMPRLEAQQNLRKAWQKLADGTLTLDNFTRERERILAGTQLEDREANYYARMIVRATQMVRQGYVKETNQGQLVDHAIKGLYKRLNEPIPSAIKDKLSNVKNVREVELLQLLADARKHLGKREDLANGKDITHSLQAMLNKLDRHTDYIDPETLERIRVEIQGHFYGIGVQIRKNNTKDMLQVVTPIKDSPAYKKKIQEGDIITHIIREENEKGEPLPEVEKLSTKGMSTEEAVKKILGKEGTKVKLIIEREGVEKPIELELIRGKVEVETVLGHHRTKDDSWDYVIDPENRICYVRLTQFSRNTYRDLAAVMKKLSDKGIKGFILDLRFNPGGLLDSAVKISDLFIDDGMIVTVRPRNGPEMSYVGRSDGSYLTFPMVCLVNGYSASGSEIVAACLQDHNRAIIMGSRSYGKGSVQTIHPFDTGGQLKLTTASFWRPNGRNLNKASTAGKEEDEWGVTPDKGFNLSLGAKELQDLQEHLRWHEIIHRPDRPSVEPNRDFKDRQLEMALEYLRGQIKATARADSLKKAG